MCDLLIRRWIILVLAFCIGPAGCATTARLYPSGVDEQRSIREALEMVEPRDRLTIRMVDGSEVQGRLLESLGDRDSVVVLSTGPGRAAAADTLPIAGIRYLGKRRGWTSQGQVLIAGAFALVVVGALASDSGDWGPR
ncbi:MAG: hypothetical protein GF346_12460 [Candidatus Eisenbacteria bacterium]|nr:hypothetical protein [Candidatus Latescibacterota bacterium]MBD3303249.1 hypothetical protein [Candidatus Eisenbacteria bacterium]